MPITAGRDEIINRIWGWFTPARTNLKGGD